MSAMIQLDLTTEQVAIARARKVLVVDEDFIDLRNYSLSIRQQGYDVRACNSYSEALECLESDVFDLIIVSQGGPEFEGRCILERAMEIDRHTPVFVLTRYLDIGCYIDAMHLGAHDYFEKPLAHEELARLVKDHSAPRSFAA